MSNTHSPGYPLYVLAGKLFSLLPVGSPGFRLGIFSAASAAGAAALLYRFSARLLGKGSEIASATGALALFLTPAMALQSAMPEKYAFSTMLVCALFLLILAAWQDGPRRLPALAFMLGTSFSHHMMTIYLVPAVLALLWRDRTRLGMRNFFILALLSGIGLTLKPLALVLLSMPSISLTSGSLNTVNKMVDYLFVAEYSSRFLGLDSAAKLSRIWAFGLQTIWWQAGILLAVLAGLGAVRAWRDWKPFLAAGLLGSAMAVMLVANLLIARIENYLLPTMALVCILGAGGLDWLKRWLGKAGTIAAGSTLIFISGLGSLPHSNFSSYYGTIDWARNILSSIDRGGVVISLYDDEFFAPMYFTRVLGERTDVIQVHQPMFSRPWYHARVEALHPGFKSLDYPAIPPIGALKPGMFINLLLRSQSGVREVAFTYIPGFEVAGGFTATPDFAVFRVGRREKRGPVPSAGEFSRQAARMRQRNLFGDFGPTGYRLRQAAGALPSSWVNLAAAWYNAGNPGEARLCMKQALRYPYNRVIKADIDRMRLAMKI